MLNKRHVHKQGCEFCIRPKENQDPTLCLSIDPKESHVGKDWLFAAHRAQKCPDLFISGPYPLD